MVFVYSNCQHRDYTSSCCDIRLCAWYRRVCAHGKESLCVWYRRVCAHGIGKFVHMVSESLCAWYRRVCAHGIGEFVRMVMESLCAWYRRVCAHFISGLTWTLYPEHNESPSEIYHSVQSSLFALSV